LGSRAREIKPEIEIVKVRRRQRRSTLTRQKILDAAATEFAVAGFDGTTTRSIATRAKVPHGLVIHHFGTKEGVWQSVTESVLKHLHGELSKKMRELAGCDAATRLKEGQRIFIRAAAKRPELNWVLSRTGGEASLKLQSLLESLMGSDIDYATDLIREVQKLGRYAKGDPAHLNLVFFGAASRIFMFPREVERTMGQSPFDEDFVERHTILCQNLFFRDSPSARPNGKVRSRKKSLARRRPP
jgi:TetR/AcrR family transcriptional regulator